VLDLRRAVLRGVRRSGRAGGHVRELRGCRGSGTVRRPARQPAGRDGDDQAGREALILSIVGFFCCGILLEPMALVKAIKVRRQAKISPVRIKGHEEATIAMVISIIALILWVVVTTARLWLIANK
jgi:hypothetical protein